MNDDPSPFVDLPGIIAAWHDALDTCVDDEVVAFVPLLMDIPPSERGHAVQHLLDDLDEFDVPLTNGHGHAFNALARACLYQVLSQTQDLTGVDVTIPITSPSRRYSSVQEYTFIVAMEEFIGHGRSDCVVKLLRDTCVDEAAKVGSDKLFEPRGLGYKVVRLLGELGVPEMMSEVIDGWKDHESWGIAHVGNAILMQAIGRDNRPVIDRLIGVDHTPLADTSLSGSFIDTHRHTQWGSHVGTVAHLWTRERQGHLRVVDGATYWPQFFSDTITELCNLIGSHANLEDQALILECLTDIYQEHFSSPKQAETSYLMLMNFVQRGHQELCDWLLNCASPSALDMIVQDMKPSWKAKQLHMHPRLVQHVLQGSIQAEQKASAPARKM